MTETLRFRLIRAPALMQRVPLTFQGILLKLSSDFIDGIGFDDIAGFDIVEILDA